MQLIRVKAHGLALWESRRGIFPPVVTRAVDLGCGHGRLFARWRDEGIDGWGVDFSDHALDAGHPYRAHFIRACLWELSLPQRFDLGVCADVMEHIPEVMVPQTLDRIAAHVDTAIFKIANFPSRSLWSLKPPPQPSMPSSRQRANRRPCPQPRSTARVTTAGKMPRRDSHNASPCALTR